MAIKEKKNNTNKSVNKANETNEETPKTLTIDQINEMLTRGKTTQEPSMRDRLQEKAKSFQDSYSNSVMALGDDDKLAQFDTYDFDTDTLNWWLWLALYNDSWVFKRVIDKPSQDMIRPGISINGRSDFSKVYKDIESLKSDLIRLVQWGRLFGGSVMVLLFNGISFEAMAEPMKDHYEEIKKSNIIKSYVTDRWFGCAPDYSDIVSNLANIDFGKPKYYQITFADGKSYKIHHSWVLRYENRTAPNFIKTGYLNGWGYSEGSHIIRELERDDKLKASIQTLTDKALIEVFKMKGLKGIYMGVDARTQAQLDKRLSAVQYARNVNSLTFIDSDDDYIQHNFSGLTGLADILQQNMWQIAAAVEMQGVLFGDLSNGFSTDSDSLERYDETIQNLNEAYARPVYTKLLKILYKKYDINEEISFTFNSIIPEKKNQVKIDDIRSILDICSTMIKDRALDPEQEAQIISEYLDSGQINFHFDKKNFNNLSIEKGKEVETNSLEENDFDSDEGDMGISNMRLKRTRNEERENPRRETQETSSEEETNIETPQEPTE